MTDAKDKDHKYRYRMEIQQMMFVSGETNDPPVETTSLIEDIVRSQVVEIVLHSSQTALSRGTKSIVPEDVIFLIRHDKAKVNRLRTYLSWKDVRKNAKDQQSGDLADIGGDDLLDNSTSQVAASGAPGAPGSSSSTSMDSKMLSKYKKSKIRLPWELQFVFTEQPLDTNEDDAEDEDERAATLASLKRLKTNDERTKNMTKEEYVHWSECRQASFTFRKAKRFREWCGLSHLAESRPSDDVIDILGFLTFEMVCSITEEALIVKMLEEQNGDLASSTTTIQKLQESHRKRKHLFDGPDKDVRPITSGHVLEAWRRLQKRNVEKKAIRNFQGGKLRSRVQLI
ncbi:SAGA and SAGA-like transcriptional regulatory complexes subunit [Komagataella phaffii CBS 7435]|uniref:Subunit of the SAGA and SAGA-like transcriptional regulatory complexes, interacts with Spt15p to act n=2 Tax=Komagataella phaffii TaxID=460519 RepID=C4R3E4_KOMPG|nr:uncharacterized protein PAS_chr3_0051 [Komagataella phaffii GS115]6TB4_D Chain D, Subunit of the SAGA and SAGA-like transcriptional regulatory complexes, interacts with Spt15p to act [Komagataella phaffii GS115]6TBM_D Chain D, Subunit of the SAGA and SAGA-like transcriptional regulatory complexes, interacts with Spt15p to act [Komagataella phaffii GS115]AOA63946.1 GQ67_03063T0 [Komagataella phaffii]CAH2450303.1 SAGA and SAGA-like transcriptional regulatory complexes subunit [Komagataella pha